MAYLSELHLSEGDCTGPHSHLLVIGLQGDSPIPPNWHTNLLWGLNVARALHKPTYDLIVSSGFPPLWIPCPVWCFLLPFLHMHTHMHAHRCTHTYRGSHVTAQQKFDVLFYGPLSVMKPQQRWYYPDNIRCPFTKNIPKAYRTDYGNSNKQKFITFIKFFKLLQNAGPNCIPFLKGIKVYGVIGYLPALFFFCSRYLKPDGIKWPAP